MKNKLYIVAMLTLFLVSFIFFTVFTVKDIKTQHDKDTCINEQKTKIEKLETECKKTKSSTDCRCEECNEGKYLVKLFYDLILLYFHCHISFPLVEIDFKAEDNFDSNKMIDVIYMGIKNRKFNFVILPSLFSIGKFLINGKSYVFI